MGKHKGKPIIVSTSDSGQRKTVIRGKVTRDTTKDSGKKNGK